MNQALVSKFSGVNVLVYGDVMLDETLHCKVDRISPEAPVPVVHVQSREHHLGAAANVAENIKHLGANVTLVGRVGDDDSAIILREMLDAQGILHNLVDGEVPTTLKTRVVGSGHHGSTQQLFRIDTEDTSSLTSATESKVLDVLSGSFDIIVVSDYAKGALTKRVIEKLISLGRVVVDPKPRNYDLYEGVFLVKPNLREAVAMTGSSDVDVAIDLLREKLDCEIIITRGPDGVSFFSEGKVVNIPTKARAVYDVTGAGDTTTAALACALGAGASLFDAVHLANLAAGIAVSKHGTASVLSKELLSSLEDELSNGKEA